LLTALWAFLFAPFLSASATPALTFATTASYAVVLTAMLAMGAIMSTQVAGLPGQFAPLLLMCAAVVESAWEIAWLAGEFSGRSYVGLFYNFGDVLCFALVATAALAERDVSPAQDLERSLESSAHGFLPAVSVLVAVALLSGSAITARNWGAWIPVLLVLLVAALLVARQRGVRAEIGRLNHALAVRESDARLTELVRRSDDLIVVLNAALELTFVSPAALPMLGLRPEALRNTAAARMLGPGNEARLAAFLDALKSGTDRQAHMEAAITTARGPRRLLHISGTNQLANRLIAGIALTLRDVTAQRSLEREILDIAARERLRLCSDVHEGLGQELSGIALLLHCAAARPNTDPRAQQGALEDIVAHVYRTIALARGLAEELSPLHVARGSLATALSRLARDLGERAAVQVRFEPPAHEPMIDVGIADQLYRIAKEATGNALRHSGCSELRIAWRTGAEELELSVTDNGHGIDPAPAQAPGLGLRMMQLRARAIGGGLRIEPAAGGGTRMVVTVPVRSDATPVDRAAGPPAPAFGT